MRFHFSLFSNLIRVLFPRWNFFDRIAHSFELEFKIPDATVWRSLSECYERPLWGLFFNPEVNLALAEGNILEHFARDIQEIQDDQGKIDSAKVKQLTSFKLLKSLLEMKIEELGLLSYPIQFKVVAQNETTRMDLYISDWISWSQK